jgi:hypothetical protein
VLARKGALARAAGADENDKREFGDVYHHVVEQNRMSRGCRDTSHEVTWSGKVSNELPSIGL